mgnify:CR=1 FL=1
MKKYEGTMKKYEGNMKKYEGNMKKYEKTRPREKLGIFPCPRAEERSEFRLSSSVPIEELEILLCPRT